MATRKRKTVEKSLDHRRSSPSHDSNRTTIAAYFSSPEGQQKIEALTRGSIVWFLAQYELEDDCIDAVKMLMKSTVKHKILSIGMSQVLPSLTKNELARLKKDKDRIQSYVPAPSREKIRLLLKNPDIFPRIWLKQSLQHTAFHELMASLLYNALKEFTIQVNPFFSSWGLPALLKKTSPFGSFDPFGVGNKVIESIRTEFEKQLEPQIKSFLSLFTATALNHAFSFITSSSHQDLFSDLRTDMFQSVLDEKVSTFTSGLDKKSEKLVCDIIVEMTIHLLEDPRTEVLLDTAMTEYFSHYKGKKISFVLEQFGISIDSLVDDFSQSLLPLVKIFMLSPPFLDMMASLPALPIHPVEG